MIGHQQILQERQQGRRPVACWVMLGVTPPPCLDRCEYAENALSVGTYPTVYLPPDEVPYRQDWRFLQGMRVHAVSPVLTDTVLEQAESIIKDGADTVVLTDCLAVMIYRDGEWQAWIS